jgi:DNA-binding IclR family transcriptional regulator
VIGSALVRRQATVAYTYHELKEKTIAELRDIAKGIDDESVKGFSQMNKEHLLPAICNALHIDVHEHHEVIGIDKANIKARIRTLKKERDAALEAHDSAKLKSVRRRIHSLNRQIRAHVSP